MILTIITPPRIFTAESLYHGSPRITMHGKEAQLQSQLPSASLELAASRKPAVDLHIQALLHRVTYLKDKRSRFLPVFWCDLEVASPDLAGIV